MSRIIRCWLMLLLAYTLAACDRDVNTRHISSAASSSAVYSVNYPLYYFAKRIAGPRLNIVFPIPGDIDPAYWQPTSDIIADFQRTALLLLNGAGYAHWLEAVSLPEKTQINTSLNFQTEWIPIRDQTTHSHGLNSLHSHTGFAFTTWLDLSLAQRQAESVLRALVQLDAEYAGIYRKNYQILTKDLHQLDQELLAVGQRLSGMPVIFSHPVYQYFERRYQINGRSVHWEPDDILGANEWKELDLLLAKHPAKLMIWEGQPSPKISAALIARGLQVVVFETAANRVGDNDFLEVMTRNIKNLQSAI